MQLHRSEAANAELIKFSLQFVCCALRLTDEEKAIVDLPAGHNGNVFRRSDSSLAAQDILLETAVNGAAYKVAFPLGPWVRALLIEHPELAGAPLRNRT